MMQYEGPVAQNKEAIIQVIDAGNDASEVNRAVLSAIFYHDAEFAGEILLQSLRNTKGDDRISLLRMTQTFMQVHKTVYLSLDFLREMEGDAGVSKILLPEVNEIKAELHELNNIYDGRTFHDMDLSNEREFYIKLPGRSSSAGANEIGSFNLTEYANQYKLERLRLALSDIEIKLDLNIEGKITGVKILTYYAERHHG